MERMLTYDTQYVCRTLPVCACAFESIGEIGCDPFTCACEVMGEHKADDERMCAYCGAELVQGKQVKDAVET